jgi:L-lactate dehydrogenase complex protein LldG
MVTGDRQRILNRIRRVQQSPVELPSLDQAWIRYDDPVSTFLKTVAAVGGIAHVVGTDREAGERMQSVPGFRTARRIFSQVPEIAESTIQMDDASDPHNLADVEYAIFRGAFGVAENAAIWLTDEQIPHRVLFFLAEHLVVVLPAEQILDNLHQAYERLAFPDRSFGVFMSGPSKTADIEQSLVIGAHGARSLTVFLIQSTQRTSD